jgi:quercetin dioxygenase-like cupin family protein
MSHNERNAAGIMKVFSLNEMKGGWFMGDFEPTSFRTSGFEVGSKRYVKGDSEPEHIHRVATEVTLILTGRVRMNGREFAAGEIVLLEPGEAASFEALEDSVTVVVKSPSVPGDKFLATSDQGLK